jgi:hypothetical protein
MLLLDAGNTFSGTVAGFGEPDYIDFGGIAFTSGTTISFTEAANNTSGTLVVSDGTHTAQLTLLGQYAATQFTSASDGHGGTLIGDPSQTSTAQAPLVMPPHA